MACRVIAADGGVTIVCTRGGSRRPCSVAGCTTTADRLCDFLLERPTFGQQPRTCDAPVCARHAHATRPGTDYCPAHAPVEVA